MGTARAQQHKRSKSLSSSASHGAHPVALQDVARRRVDAVQVGRQARQRAGVHVLDGGVPLLKSGVEEREEREERRRMMSSGGGRVVRLRPAARPLSFTAAL